MRLMPVAKMDEIKHFRAVVEYRKKYQSGSRFSLRGAAMKMMLDDCRVKVTVDVIRGKWKPIIIKALKNSSLSYAEFLC